MRKVSATVVVGCLTVCLLTGEALPQQQTQFESFLTSAQQAQARGDFRSAAEFYQKAVTLQPGFAELQTNLGLMYYQTGNDQQAIHSFLEAIRLNPSLFVPNLFLGLDYVKIKRFDDAIPYLKRAAVIKPSDPQAELALGQAYAATGKGRLAIHSYLRMVHADSTNADGWFHLGVAYLEQIEADARILLAQHKDSGYFHAMVAETFAEQHAFLQAAEAYKAALAAQAFPSGTHAGYGFVLLNERDFPAAELELNAELASNPGSLIAKLGLARLKLEQGAAPDAAKAIVEIWKTDAVVLQANAPLFNTGLSRSTFSELQDALENRRANGEIPEAVIALFQSSKASDQATELSQSSPTALDGNRPTKTAAVSAKELYASGEYGACSDKLAARLPTLQAKELRLLESCAYLTARYPTAFDAAEKLALNPATAPEGLYWETRSAQKLATQALARASAINSNSPTLHVLLGDIYRQRKFYADAEQEYRKALAIQPEDSGALLGLSLALLADSDVDGASHLSQAALQKNPDDPEFNAVMGEILCARHDFSGAEPYLKKSLKTKPEYVPHVHALLGEVYAHTERIYEAIAELKLALPHDKDGDLHYQLGRLYQKIGDQDSAKEAFRVSQQLIGEGVNRAAVAMQQGQGNSESQ